MRLLLPGSGRPLDDPADLEALYGTPPAAALRANFVVCLDGAIELGGRSGSLGGPLDRAVFATLRAVTDVILVGAGTVRTENYGPARLEADVRERRSARGQAPSPTMAVVTRKADLAPDSRLFSRQGIDRTTPPRPLILTCEAAAAEARDSLAEVADVVICGDSDVEHRRALDVLRDRGLAQVLCEGGPSLFTSLAAEGLVDDICLTHAPLLAGPGRASLSMGEEWDEPRRWALASLAEGDGMLFARYERLEPGG